MRVRWLFGSVVAGLVLALVWPGPQLWMASPEPFVLGLPRPLWFVVACLLAGFLALWCYDARHRGEGDARS